MALRRKLTVASALLLVVGAAVTVYAGGVLVEPSTRVVGPAPADLPAVDARFTTPRGNTLSGWWFPREDARGAVVLGHTLRTDRRKMLGRARVLLAAGYAVLCFDFQAHGESPGEVMTFGRRESEDLRAAVDWVRAEAPGLPVAVVGWSLGGAAAVLAEPPLSVAALVLEEVYPRLEDAVDARLRIRLGWLTPLVKWPLLWQLEPRTGVAVADLQPIAEVPRITAPILVLAGSVDQRTPLDQSRELYAAAPSAEELVVFEGARHQDLLSYDGELWREKVLGFLAAHLGR